ncbi:UbiA family prenyltransferase [Pyxidicoccus parkwayensis]|uniref:UbiA family prenyltransferase n=1 Tax=Pyxidicoccus parkwayensis TaxID=2813578 RepID=A0ABX7P161_9BACT|nr:UbiA family prenyltransferase [Pyxidicoccus parkwaysis]QSQ23572.1 UbiA family prenyltransferase [Pyxidicoccus parkwaysis]
MHVESMGLAGRWWYALKPASWPKVFVPALFGQAVGAAQAGRVSVGALAFGALWMVADVAFIVLLNDWGDRAVDALKRRMFPKAGSPKTIPDGILPAEALLAAGLGAGVVALLLAALAGTTLERPLLAPLSALALFVFIAYSLPPLRLNYRGGGEVLEMVGVGAMLPALHAYAQCGQWAPAGLVALLPGLLALSLSSALASGLSDEESDRAGGKRTWASVRGNAAARRGSEVLLVLGALLWLVVPGVMRLAPLRTVLPAAVVLFFAMRVRRRSADAVTNAFGAQSAYKLELHRAIWWGTFMLSGLVLMSGLGLFSGVSA